MSQASVYSIDALKEFRATLVAFAEDAMNALGGVDMEARRTTRWLVEEQRLYWEGEIKRRREKVAMARSELSRRKLSGMFGHATSHSEQKELLEIAESRLKEAEQRALKVKKWTPVLQQTILEYQSTTRQLVDLIGGELPRALALLDRIIDSLEAYTQVAPPSGAIATSTPRSETSGERLAAPRLAEETEPSEPAEAHSEASEAAGGSASSGEGRDPKSSDLE
ncbi:MAG: hypothetical protein IRY99_01415 [Isosphaeraceae bacterium]|nr:hypothetical protein [Isosphaeraceae bacterium]